MESSSKEPLPSQEDIRLDVLSDPKLLSSVREMVRRYVTGFGFSRDRVDDVVLAVDEACSNSIRHAYEGRKDARLDLRLRSDAEYVEVVLRDLGTPAPADRVARKELRTPSLDSLKPGGLGVGLIHAVFDEVEFRANASCGNCVVMRLKLPDKKD